MEYQMPLVSQIVGKPLIGYFMQVCSFQSVSTNCLGHLVVTVLQFGMQGVARVESSQSWATWIEMVSV